MIENLYLDPWSARTENIKEGWVGLSIRARCATVKDLRLILLDGDMGDPWNSSRGLNSSAIPVFTPR